MMIINMQLICKCNKRNGVAILFVATGVSPFVHLSISKNVFRSIHASQGT